MFKSFRIFSLFVIMIKAVVTVIISIIKTIQNFIYLLYSRLFVAAFLFVLYRRYLMMSCLRSFGRVQQASQL